MVVTSCANATSPKPYRCGGVCCPIRTPTTMDSAPHYYLCQECRAALCPHCAVDQSQLYKFLLSIDSRKTDKSRERSSFTKDGNLLKKGMGRLYRPWADRYFILDEEGVLGYYHKGENRGAINVKGSMLSVLRPSEANGRSFAFKLIKPDIIHHGSLLSAGELILAASSLEDASEWCACLLLAISRFADKSSEVSDKDLLPHVSGETSVSAILAGARAIADSKKEREEVSSPRSALPPDAVSKESKGSRFAKMGTILTIQRNTSDPPSTEKTKSSEKSPKQLERSESSRELVQALFSGGKSICLYTCYICLMRYSSS